MIKYKDRRFFIVVSVLAAAAASLPVGAQEDAAPALEEVLVTARKRLENLQDIPISVTAFGSEQIRRRDLRTLEDLAGDTTGLVYENYSTSGLSAAPVIRGMSLTFATAREQNTSVFLDGIYLQRQSMLNPNLVDMERVEIVKGPQNALYGRNAFAGAINYVTPDPTEEFSGSAGITYGTDEREDYSFGFGGPIFGDQLLGRIFYSTSEFDGHTDNEHPLADLGPGGDSTDGALGGWDDELFSASLLFRAGDALSIRLGYFKSRSDRESQPFYNLDGARQNDATNPENTLNCLNTATAFRQGPIVSQVTGHHAWCGEFPKTPPHRNDLAALGLAGNILVDPRSFAVSTDTELWTARLEWDLGDEWYANYLFGYTEHDGAGSGVQADFKSVVGDGVLSGFGINPNTGRFGPLFSDVTTFNSNPEETLEASSHEIQIGWDGGGALRARGGLYYSEVEDSSWNTFWFVSPCDSAANCEDGATSAAPVLSPIFPPGLGHGRPTNLTFYEDEIYAVFGELSWDLTERLTLGMEARYTREDKSFEQSTTSFGVPHSLADDDDFTYFTPRFTAQYQWTDERLLYASLGKGVKTGGFNSVDSGVNPQQAVFDEEQNWALEFGGKNTLMNGNLLLNGAMYYIRWTDQQGTESADDPNPFASDVIGNIGDVDIYGIELETVYRISSNWSLDAGYTYNKPEFDDAVYSPAVADTNSSFGCDDSVCRADGDVSGNVLQRASERQAQAGINYRGNIAGWTLDARLDANYRSRMYATPLNLAHNGDRTLANLSVSLSGENWQLSFWGKNITDEEYVANSFVLPSFSGYIVALGAGDTWGLSARYSF